MDPDLGLLSSDVPPVNSSYSSSSSSSSSSDPSSLSTSDSSTISLSIPIENKSENFQINKYYVPYDKNRCLFCASIESTFKQFFLIMLIFKNCFYVFLRNLDHMVEVHSFELDEPQYIIDFDNLLAYLHDKVLIVLMHINFLLQCRFMMGVCALLVISHSICLYRHKST
jgi:hypothetical protein